MRVESLEIGASGIVRLRTDGGSPFLFRLEYLPPEAQDLPAVGDEADPAFLSAAEEASAIYAAEAKSLDLLARAEQSRHLLSLKLRKRGMPDSVSSKALDRLERLGLLSDERFARAWAEERARRRGDGPFRVAAGLAARGIGDDLARKVCGEVFRGEERGEILLRAVRRLLRSGRKDEAEAAGRLRSEGWKPSEIRAALEFVRDERY